MSLVQQKTMETKKVASEGEDLSDAANDNANFEVNAHSITCIYIF